MPCEDKADKSQPFDWKQRATTNQNCEPSWNAMFALLIQHWILLHQDKNIHSWSGLKALYWSTIIISVYTKKYNRGF